MEIKIIGKESKSRTKLIKNINKVKKDINLPIDIILNNEFIDIEKYKHINKPILIINDKIISTGKVLTDREIKNYVKLFA